MYGVVTRNAGETDWPEFERAYFEAKDVSGRATEPQADAVNMVSCFGDNAAVADDPSMAPVDDAGRPATRERPYFDWSYVDPTHPDYRERVLGLIEECAAANPAVRLDDVGFPRDEYCHCDRCDRAFAAADTDDRSVWRASVITEFIEAATDRIPGHTSLTLYPDPYPGHLRARAGLDLEAIAPLVEEFVVPLYDTHYGTTYWLESLARGFRSRVAELDADVDLAVELYAVNVDVDDLIHAAEVAETYADDVLFGYDASQAAAAIRRKRADARGGVEHTPLDETDDDPPREDGDGA